VTRYRIIRFAELDSTNRHASANLRELADGDVIQADIQTAGHGRLRRPWISHLPGNLCMTLVLKPTQAAPGALPLANLSQLLALSVCRALAASAVPATLKWPNDVLVGGRKIAGLLAETVVQGAEFVGMVLGVGVNLNLDAAALATIDQPATSLAEWTGSPVAVDDFRDAVLEDFFGRCDGFLTTGFGLIREEYQQDRFRRRGDGHRGGRLGTLTRSCEKSQRGWPLIFHRRAHRRFIQRHLQPSRRFGSGRLRQR
jgi:BirA family biotin operon repressor/biotin-[acetyl-CoA-carboxylase] ligase